MASLNVPVNCVVEDVIGTRVPMKVIRIYIGGHPAVEFTWDGISLQETTKEATAQTKPASPIETKG